MPPGDYTAPRGLPSRSSRARGLCILPMIALLAGVVAGCGATSREQQSPQHPVGRSLLSHHDLPPHGVRRQIAYYVQGGGLGCEEQHASKLAIAFARSPLRAGRSFLTPRGSRQPEQGEAFAVCIFGTSSAASLQLAMQAPDGTARRTTLMPDRGPSGETVWITRFADRAPPGRWVVTVRQGDRTAERAFTLSPPPRPDYHVVATTGGTEVSIGLLGLHPFERVRLLFYRAARMFRANFVAAVTLHAGRDGIGRFRLHVPPREPSICYVVKAQVRDRLLDDLYNTISGFCSPAR